MSVTVVGSLAFDTVETPFGLRERILGGAATHSSISASFFTEVRVVGVVGEDFGEEEFGVFERRGILTGDVERVVGGKSFFWSGHYENDLQVAHTRETQLNVFAEFDPSLSPHACGSSVVFLANIQPDLQLRVREQCKLARITGLDSMNYWIESARDSLEKAISSVDVIVLNEEEVRMFTGEPSVIKAAQQILRLGPSTIVVKQGAYGVCVVTAEGFFFVPGYPLETVKDPTGAGDSFAGGFFGYLDHHGDSIDNDQAVRTAAVYGSVMASYSIEEFGTERMQRLTTDEIDTRYAAFKRMTHFEPSELRAAGTTRV